MTSDQFRHAYKQQAAEAKFFAENGNFRERLMPWAWASLMVKQLPWRAKECDGKIKLYFPGLIMEISPDSSCVTTIDVEGAE